MYKYQNVSESEQTIVAEGNINPRVVAAGEFTLADRAIENPNFKYIGEFDEEGKEIVRQVDATAAPDDNAVTDAQIATPETQTNQETN